MIDNTRLAAIKDVVNGPDGVGALHPQTILDLVAEIERLKQFIRDIQGNLDAVQSDDT